MRMAVFWEIISSETSVNIYQTIRCNIPEGRHLYIYIMVDSISRIVHLRIQKLLMFLSLGFRGYCSCHLQDEGLQISTRLVPEGLSYTASYVIYKMNERVCIYRPNVSRCKTY
jgi:hypothetical protein